MLNSASVRIVRDVREWLSGSGRDDSIPDVDWLPNGNATYCLEILLQARQDWLNSPDPTLWKTGDAHRVLIDAAAPRLTDIYELSRYGAAALKVLIDYLDETDRFHPASMRVVTLRKELDKATAKFTTAMADESVWRLAKRVFTAAMADGVDLGDDGAADAWAAAFSEAPQVRKRAVLGVLVDRQPELLTARFLIRDRQVLALSAAAPIPAKYQRHKPDAVDTPGFPPVTLPSDRELADAARQSELLRTLIGCGHWAAAGRAMTKKGLPSAADTRSLGAVLGLEVSEAVRAPREHLTLWRIWKLALETEVLRLHRTKVVAGPGLLNLEQAMAGEPDHVLRVWREIAELALTRTARPDALGKQAADMVEFTRLWGPRALGEMYRRNGSMPLDGLVEKLVANYYGLYPSEALPMMVGAAVRASLLAGTEAGAVIVTVPDNAGIGDDIAPMIDGFGRILGDPVWAAAPIPGTLVELTPLGRYMVRLGLLVEGSHAPLLTSAT